ncbi:hypothetical protein RvY_02571 [Ramazzottius varieornatus]|uniref:Uncharacterized protein n=1 Tax=Ramazzottius varieornatus TaxID=947166 RepID=A0A1D1UQZ5_RAMVA|nr:hypothetical protein RvY_02571 [Ramazzottius varieornatus]
MTQDEVCQRDPVICEECRARNVPIAMVSSGGFESGSDVVLATSILNLRRQRLLDTEVPSAICEPPNEGSGKKDMG